MLDVLTYALAKAFTKKSVADCMQKADYDSDGDGVVDNSKRLNGNLSSYYAKEEEIIFFLNDEGYVCQRVLVEDS